MISNHTKCDLVYLIYMVDESVKMQSDRSVTVPKSSDYSGSLGLDLKLAVMRSSKNVFMARTKPGNSEVVYFLRVLTDFLGIEQSLHHQRHTRYCLC